MTAGSGYAEFHNRVYTKWQAPWCYIDMPIPGGDIIQAYASWISKDLIEIRIYDKEKQQALIPTGQWINVKDMDVIPVAKSMSPSELIDRKIIEPLKEGVHTYDYNYDRCLTCRRTGQYFHNIKKKGLPDDICPGWLW